MHNIVMHKNKKEISGEKICSYTRGIMSKMETVGGDNRYYKGMIDTYATYQ